MTRRRGAAGAAVVARLVRVEARRPLAWLAAGVAAMAVLGLSAAPRPAAAAGCGVILAAAAVAPLRGGAPAVPLFGARLAARVAWPLGGAVVGGAAAAVRGCGAGAAAWLAAGAGGTAAVAAVAERWLRSAPGPVAPVGAAAHPAAVGHRWGDAIAMATTLAAMAACYFLAPEHAEWYAIVATAWVTLLAVPVATLPAGDAACRRALVRSAPGRPRVAGTAAGGAWLLAGYAALLGWPAVVAAVLRRDAALAVDGPLAAVAAVASLAILAAAVNREAWLRSWSEETPVAVVSAAHVLALVAAVRHAGAP